MTGIAETNMKRGWVVVAICFVAMAFTFGARSSVSMVLPLWQAELGWTGSESSAGAWIVLTMMALGSPIAGNVMDRYGARRVIATGLTALALGVGGTSFVSNSLYYYLLFGIVGGIGWASVSIPLVTAAVSGYFVKYRGLAIGIAVSGATGGQLPVLSLLGVTIAVLGWRDAYQILAVLLAIFAALVYLRFKPPLANSDDPAQRNANTIDDTLADRLQLLFGNRTFLLLLGAFSLCGFTTAGVIDVYFIPYAISCGFTLIEGSAAYGVHGLGNLAGVILFSWVADHVNRPRLLATMFFLRAFAFVLLMFISADISVMFIFAAIFGILNFSTFPVIANIVVTHIGVRIIGLTLGLLFGGHSLGAAIGVVLGGWMFDLTARYEWVWWVSAGLAAMAGVFAILVKENRPPRDTKAVPAAA
ncbi:MAG: MFS transporter [Alphaproteobacteria bacterium]|nr:MFS transporter [Alphaproteobacteria bacterium]